MNEESKIDQERKEQAKRIALKRAAQDDVAKQEELLMREARQAIRYIKRNELNSPEHAIHWFVNMCHDDLLHLVFVVRRSIKYYLLSSLYNVREHEHGTHRNALFWAYVKEDMKNEKTRAAVLNLIIEKLHLSIHTLQSLSDGEHERVAATLGGNKNTAEKTIDTRRWHTKRLLDLYESMYKFNESVLYSLGRMERKHMYEQPIHHLRTKLETLAGEDGQFWREFMNRLAKPIVDILARYCAWSYQEQIASYCVRHYPVSVLQNMLENGDGYGRSILIRCCTAVRVMTTQEQRVNAAYVDKQKNWLVWILPFQKEFARLLLSKGVEETSTTSSSSSSSYSWKKTGFNSHLSFANRLRALL